MSDSNELEKTIEELEAEVIAELEEATDELEEVKSDAMKPKANATPAEKGSKIEGERQDTGKPVVDPERHARLIVEPGGQIEPVIPTNELKIPQELDFAFKSENISLLLSFPGNGIFDGN